jgi:hypothetical protein
MGQDADRCNCISQNLVAAINRKTEQFYIAEDALLGLAVMYRRSADMIHVRRTAEHSTGNGASASGTAEDAS